MSDFWANAVLLAQLLLGATCAAAWVLRDLLAYIDDKDNT